MSARTSERKINAKLHTQRAVSAPLASVHALKPLNKILSLSLPGRKPMVALRPIRPLRW
jgi:hypothetical protein